MNLGATAMNVAANRLNKAPSLLMHDGSMNQFGTTADFHLRQRAGGIGLRKLRHAAGHLGYKSAKIGGVGSLTEFPKSCTHEETLQKQAALYNWLAKTWKITLKVISHIHKVIKAQTYRFPHGYYTLYMHGGC